VTFDASAIPQDLKDRKQWLIWRFEKNPKKPEGKPLKVPYYADGSRRFGVQGDEKDRAKLATFDVALASMQKRNCSGFGFAFLPGDGLIGIDIDKCIDLDTGEISPMADGVIQECLSYTEYSPSRSGVHIIVAGETQTFKSDKIGLEVFCGSQFFTFTGQSYGGLPLVVTPIAEATLDRMRGLVLKARSSARPPGSAPTTSGAPRERTPFEERALIMSALASIPPDEHAIWIKVGMALYNTFGDVGGFTIWDDWSSQSAKYDAGDLAKRWSNFKSKGVQATAGSILGIARDFNWHAPRPSRPPSPPIAAPKESPPPPGEIAPPLVDELPAAATGAEDEPDAVAPPPLKGKPELRVVGGHDLPGGEPPDNTAYEGGQGAAGADAGQGKGKKKVQRGESFWNAVDHLLDHFVLLYGTNTAWDEVNAMQIKITDLRYAYSSDAVKFWLANPDRKMINYDHLVFDPTGMSKPQAAGLRQSVSLPRHRAEARRLQQDHGTAAVSVQW